MKNALKKFNSFLLICIASVISISTTAADVTTGKEKTVSCAGCHGTEGVSEAGMFPNLAGQHAEYLESALKQYRDGDRENDMMTPMAKGLSDTDIKDIAAYYSSLKDK